MTIQTAVLIETRLHWELKSAGVLVIYIQRRIIADCCDCCFRCCGIRMGKARILLTTVVHIASIEFPRRQRSERDCRRWWLMLHMMIHVGYDAENDADVLDKEVHAEDEIELDAILKKVLADG